MKKRHALGLSLALLAGALAVPAHAQEASSAEKAALARLAAEVRVLEQLISEGQRNADSDARVAFDYGRLRHDLDLVRAEMEDYVSGHRSQPRRFEPIKPNYVQLPSSGAN